MSILSNHFGEVLDELNADPDRPADTEPTEAEINAMGDAAGQLLTEASCHQIAAPTSAGPPRKPRQQPQRSVRLLSRTHGMYELPDVATVEITLTTSGPHIGNRTDTFRYTVASISSDFGKAFQVTREDTGETYAVNLNGRLSSCECKGHLQWGHCKQVEGLQALVNLAKL
jgi:hypothetical protein